MMKLALLRRKTFPESDAVFGEMSIDGVFECLTLERLSVIIPEGTYPLTFYFSPHNRCQVLLLQNVPGRSSIEIHIANYPAQLEGCIALGTVHNQDSISNSRFAFTQFMQKVEGQSGLTLTITSE